MDATLACSGAPQGYARQHALRQPQSASSGGHTASKKKQRQQQRQQQQQPQWKEQASTSSTQRKTLMDALKQHGTRLCDGTRLNAVGKGVQAIGRVPPSVSAHITALYLSQNNLRSLDGVQQFVAVRLLSVGGNLLSRDAEVALLAPLAQLRQLNLTGNPLCDQPNYRLRVLDTLRQLQVLDNADVTKKEREMASRVAAQDEARRALVTQNHLDILKLQHVVQLITLHQEFYGRVLVGVSSGRFDRVPSPSEAACNVPLLLRLWRYQDTLSERERQTLELQMLAIVVRTHGKLADHPKLKAKAYLLKLASADGGSVPSEIQRRCACWEEAYAAVIALQQKTIVDLQGLCERKRRDMVEFLKEVLATDPRARVQLVGGQCTQRYGDCGTRVTVPSSRASPRRSSVPPTSWTSRTRFEDQSECVSVQYQLPPQQEDPDVIERDGSNLHQSLSRLHQSTDGGVNPHQFPRKAAKGTIAERRETSGKEGVPSSTRNLKAGLRSGDFGNRSLGEAIHSFALRDSAPEPPKLPLRKGTANGNFVMKPQQIHHAYPMIQQENFVLPPEVTAKQQQFFPSRVRAPEQSNLILQHGFTAEMQHSSEDSGLGPRGTDVSTEFSYDGRVSTVLTRDEELDNASISEVSGISCSPRLNRVRENPDLNTGGTNFSTRAGRVGTRSAVPVVAPLPSSQRPVRPKATRSFSRDNNSPHNGTGQSVSGASANDSRLQELEQREEKYIRALMESEQRELDLRNNLAGVQRKLASYQCTLSQQLHEREQIKAEVARRTLAMAAPKILVRFFVRWIRFYNWSQRMKHVCKKRCFIVQHDRFWQWRRKVWVQQELRGCLRKHQLRVRWQHFTEWLNITRVSVIAKRARELRETRFLSHVLLGWSGVVALRKQRERLQQGRREEALLKLQYKCFREWRRLSRHKVALRKVQNSRWKGSLRAHQQVAFWSWKIFLVSVARPLQEKAACFRSRVQTRQIRRHFQEWRKLARVGKMHSARLQSRVWRRWVTWRRRLQSEQTAKAKAKLAVVSVFFVAWRLTATEQLAMRRSLSLAKRYVNRRRLRKLWMHWKYFSMAKRKYTQGSTKALKHYFVKLLRASWKQWRYETQTNLQKARTKKYGVLQRHFTAFRDGLRLERAETSRVRMVAHITKRRQWALVRFMMAGWVRYAEKRKRAKWVFQLMSRQREQGCIGAVWRRWKSLHIQHLARQMVLLRQHCEMVVQEKHSMEAKFTAAKDTEVSLADQMEFLVQQNKEQEQQLLDLQEKLQRTEKQNACLETKVEHARSAIERERREWEDALCEEEQGREVESRKYRSLAQENQVLQVRAIELQRELEAEKSKLVSAMKTVETVTAEKELAAANHELKLESATKKQKEFEGEIAVLHNHLKEKQKEMEETANRLQEYEKKIASTCKEMDEHEREYERENERLRYQQVNTEAKWKEGQARNAELICLLKEKNQLILDITHKVKMMEHAQRTDAPSSIANEQFVAVNSLRGNQEECDDTGLQRSIKKFDSMQTHTNQAAASPTKKYAASVWNQSERSRPGVFVPESRGGDLSACSAAVSSRLPPEAPSRALISSAQKDHPGQTRPSVHLSVTGGTAHTEESAIDVHTSKVHADIRLLQDRISKRLEQVPASIPATTRLRGGVCSAFSRVLKTPQSSPTPLSDEESDSTDESVAWDTRADRRARLRICVGKKPVAGTPSSILAHTAVHSLHRPPKSKARDSASYSTTTGKKTRSSRKAVEAVRREIERNGLGVGRVEDRRMENGASEPAAIETSTASAANNVSHDVVDGDQVEICEVIPLPPPLKDAVGGSPRAKGSPKRSPIKQHVNQLSIDPSSTLAAISARLAVVVPPAESEIVRINREVLAAMSKRAYEAKHQGNNTQSLEDLTDRIQLETDEATKHGSPQTQQTPRESVISSSPTAKSGLTPALHDSVVAEEWVNLHLETSGAFLLPATDIGPLLKNPASRDDEFDLDDEAFSFRKQGDGGPLGRAGIDRLSLYRLGMPKDLVDRLYRALYVYTNGFHNIINEIAARCPAHVERHVSSNVWLTFLLLLEQCENNKYEMAMLKFKQAAETSQKQMQEDFRRDKADFDAQLQIAEANLKDETARGVEKNQLINKLATETTAANITISDQQRQVAAQAEQIRLLKLEVLAHEEEEKQLNEQIDDARKDYEVANSERLNALSEQYALDEEIRKLTAQLERVEAEKANYAKRMHETLFMNQSLRASNDKLKQEAVVLGMEKDKAVAEKQAIQDQLELAQTEIRQLEQQNAQVTKELDESERKQAHLAERLQIMKVQLDAEVESNAKHQQDKVVLTAQIDEEKVKVGVLEAKCNLLTVEKQNTGMRAQDKLRIERLLNQKLELEAKVEAARQDRARDEEQIWTLRASLETLESEMQHSKRVYSAGQQAFLHSERTCEQLRQQNQEVQSNYEKTKKSLTSLKERFKLYETSAKEQITKLEVEIKVANAQLREVTYVNRDNAAQIADMTKSLALAGKEAETLKARIETSEQKYTELQQEKEDLQHSKKQLDLEHSTSKSALHRFILSLQNMLALVKLDEFPLDEALRELLQMITDTFGEELDLDNVLDDDDKPEDIEFEINDDVTEEERASREKRAAARRRGVINVAGLGGELDDDLEGESDGDGDSNSGRRHTHRMSRFRKSKLDHLVEKLQRDVALKAELIANLEGVVCDQARQLTHLTTTTNRQTRRITLDEAHIGMLRADLEDTTLLLVRERKDKQAVEFTLEQTRIDQVLQTNRAFQAEVALATLRREFDMHAMAYEDLLGRIWHAYEHDLYMRSLRREKEIQATVAMAEEYSQTLVPQRNPAMERPRMSSLYIPADPPGTTETLVQKISRATRQLLPDVSSHMDFSVATPKTKKPSKSHRKAKRGLVRELVASPLSSRARHRPQASRTRSSHSPDRQRGGTTASSSTSSRGKPVLPVLDGGFPAAPPPQIIRHVNEFGTRQDVLVSPVYPPFFAGAGASASPRPPVNPSPRLRKPEVYKPQPSNHLQMDTHYDERCDTTPRCAPGSARCSSEALQAAVVASFPVAPDGSSRLRYNRSFLRAGMEVLRNASSSGNPLPYPDDEDVDDEQSGASSDCQDSAQSYESEGELGDGESEESDVEGWLEGQAQEDAPQSPSRLAAAVSEFQQERMVQEYAARQAPSKPRSLDQIVAGGGGGQHKSDELRRGGGRDGDDASSWNGDESDGGGEVDEELKTEAQGSPFTPAVLYPILPHQ